MTLLLFVPLVLATAMSLPDRITSLGGSTAEAGGTLRVELPIAEGAQVGLDLPKNFGKLSLKVHQGQISLGMPVMLSTLVKIPADGGPLYVNGIAWYRLPKQRISIQIPLMGSIEVDQQ